MEEHVICEKTVSRRKIHAEMVCLKEGLSVLIYGGDCSHIGSVSIVGKDGKLISTVFPNHKDNAISDVWARELFARYRCPVVVSAGIHFNEITKEEIKEIEDVSWKMLAEICMQAEKKN